MQTIRQAPETVARIDVSPARGRVTARYAFAEPGWTPRNEMYLDGNNTAQVHLSGLFNGAFPSYLLHSSLEALAEHDTALKFPVNSGTTARLASFRLLVARAFREGHTEFIFICAEKFGPAALAGRGRKPLQKWGICERFRFEEILSGRTRTISAGM